MWYHTKDRYDRKDGCDRKDRYDRKDRCDRKDGYDIKDGYDRKDIYDIKDGYDVGSYVYLHFWGSYVYLSEKKHKIKIKMMLWDVMYISTSEDVIYISQKNIKWR